MDMTPLVIPANRCSPPRRRAVFLARDGAIGFHRADSLRHWDEFQFLPRTLDALRRLAALDVDIVLVCHQSSIGRGQMSLEAMYEIHRSLAATIEYHGGRVDAIYVCPHAPAEDCDCRGPRPGLLNLAALDRGINLGQSYMVGGKLSDAQAGRAAGCRAMLLAERSGPSGDDWPEGLQVVPDLYQAVLDIEAALKHPDDQPWY